MNVHINILKCLDNIINDTAMHIHDYIKNPHAFTRKRKLDAFTTIKTTINMQNNCLTKEIDDAFDDGSFAGNNNISVSAYIQQKSKLSPKCFEHIFHAFTRQLPTKAQLDHKYRLFAFDGSDFNQVWNSKSKNIVDSSKGKSYCQIHVNAMYDLLNNTYQDCVFQPKSQMDERGAALDMLRQLDYSQPYIVMMDRGYESFNIIENCNRLKNCYYVIRTKIGQGGIKEIKNLPDEFCDKNISCRITISNHYYTLHHKTENLHIVFHPKHHCKKKFANGTQDACWDFEDFCNVNFRACKIRINDPDTNKEEWEILVTNLDRQEFPLERMKELYHLRWGIESSFRKLKYDLGSVQFHSKQDHFIEMELYAHMIMFNAVSQTTVQAYVPQRHCKYHYIINFKIACLIVQKRYKVSSNDQNFAGILVRISRHTIPIRPGRKDKRNLKVKSSVSFMYRVA
mgnify:FL=1